ncbi:MAG: 4Fe-4S dicluster domain-containing protein [Gemmatimonadales bacterium]
MSVTRTYVKYVDVGTFPQTHRAFQVTRCNQCDDAPCVTACPTAAMYKRPDGIVDFDKTICIGCKACIAACPYDAIFINPDDNSAEKCNFCAHRLDIGLEPACVVVCPTQAILVGDMNDSRSKVGEIIRRDPVAVRRPEKETRPKLFYKGARQATLDPLAAARPQGGAFMWSEQFGGGQSVVSGHPGKANNSAAAILSYDSPHRAPWDWKVSLYTWTKSVAAGAYLIPLLLASAGVLDPNSVLWQLVAPALGSAFLAATGALLIADLKHPERFYMIFTRPQTSSWLVMGAFLIAGYSLVLLLHLAATALAIPGLSERLALAGLPLSIMTAVYTAYLFGQAKARDLWQSPLLAPHLLVQAVLAGSAALMPLSAWLEPAALESLSWILGASCLTHIVLTLGETTITHPTAHSKLAVYEMTAGRFRSYFLASVLLTFGGVAAPLIGMPSALLALVGLLAYEHAYVQAAQAVPLA